MEKRLRKSRVTEKNLGRKRRELSFGALEIAATAQEVIRQRLERALQRERELDEMMEALLNCAAIAEDKAAAKSVLARFDAIRIEDISKVLSILKLPFAVIVPDIKDPWNVERPCTSFSITSLVVVATTSASDFSP